MGETVSEKRKQQIREASRKYYERNKEKLSEYNHDYYEKNREKLCEYQREYRRTHRAELNEKQKEYRKAHPEIIAKINARHYAKKLRSLQDSCGDTLSQGYYDPENKCFVELGATADD